MKYATLPVEDLSLEKLLEEGRHTQSVFLSVKGKVRFVLMRADEGDQEVCAIVNNTVLMDYLRQAAERAKTGKSYTLEEIKARYRITDKKRRPPKSSRNGPRKRRSA
jgi:hypothetical protein